MARRNRNSQFRVEKQENKKSEEDKGQVILVSMLFSYDCWVDFGQETLYVYYFYSGFASLAYLVVFSLCVEGIFHVNLKILYNYDFHLIFYFTIYSYLVVYKFFFSIIKTYMQVHFKRDLKGNDSWYILIHAKTLDISFFRPCRYGYDVEIWRVEEDQTMTVNVEFPYVIAGE